MHDLHQDSIPLRPRLVDQMREAIRRNHYSLKTEKAYIRWVRRFIYFHGKRHPAQMGGPRVTASGSSSASVRDVDGDGSPGGRALNALALWRQEAPNAFGTGDARSAESRKRTGSGKNGVRSCNIAVNSRSPPDSR